MIHLRQECKSALAPFIYEYQEMCQDRGLTESSVMYQTAVQALLMEVPEQSSRKFILSQKRIESMVETVVGLCEKSSGKAVRLCLHRLVEVCKKKLPDDIGGKVVFRKRLRPEEVNVHNQVAFELLDDFIEIRNWLVGRIKTVPREKVQLQELIITSLIAVNGVVMNNAHSNISALKKSNLHQGSLYPVLDVPYAKHLTKKPQFIRYPLLEDIERLIISLPPQNIWLFDGVFSPGEKLYRWSRIQKLNTWLVDLWRKVVGFDVPVHPSWNISTFIACSSMFFTLKSSPSVAAFLSKRTNYARLDSVILDEEQGVKFETDTSVNKKSAMTLDSEIQYASDTDAIFTLELIAEIRRVLNNVNHRSQSVKNKQSIIFEMLGIISFYESLLNRQACLRYLILWLVFELSKENDKRRFGAYQRLWSMIPKMLVSELGGVSPLDLDKMQWIKLLEYLIHENDYSPSTQQKVKQHLKAFHDYLIEEYPNQVPNINWRHAEFRVQLDQNGGIIYKFSEFETLFDAAGREQDLGWILKLQAALVLSFLGGLRAEEICLLSKVDVPANLIHIQVWWSKTKMGRRRIPLALLLPNNKETKSKYSKAIKLLRDQCEFKETLLFRYNDGSGVSPDVLGKRIHKLIKENLPKERRVSIHGLRHGFASWLLIRYYVLQQPQILTMKGRNNNSLIPDFDHAIFAKSSQYNLVRVFNGRVAADSYLENPTSFLSKPEHFAYISRLIGHATRATTAKTYIHSMEWLAFYYLKKLS